MFVLQDASGCTIIKKFHIPATFIKISNDDVSLISVVVNDEAVALRIWPQFSMDLFDQDPAKYKDVVSTKVKAIYGIRDGVVNSVSRDST